jgi:hypothetical protein
MVFSKEKSAYLAEASFAAIFLICSYLAFLAYVLVSALFYHGFKASDGALIAIGIVLYGGLICGLFFAETGLLAHVCVYGLGSAFSLYEAVHGFDHLYLMGEGVLCDWYHALRVAVGILLLLAFLLGAVSLFSHVKAGLFSLACRICFEASSVLYAVSAILVFLAGDTLSGLFTLAEAFLSGALPFALKALDFLPAAVKKGL